MLEILGAIVIFALMGSIKGGPDDPLSKADIFKLVLMLIIVLAIDGLRMLVFFGLICFGLYALVKKGSKRR